MVVLLLLVARLARSLSLLKSKNKKFVKHLIFSTQTALVCALSWRGQVACFPPC